MTGGKVIQKMDIKILSTIFVLVLSLTYARKLEDVYPLSLTLNDQPSYKLHWRVDLESEEISFALNASTSGWVGFGISRTPQMVGSDVVIGWITNDGEVILHDRFATQRSLPPIDDSQDWMIMDGKFEDGHTIIEMKRKLITSCYDDSGQDIDITTDSMYLVWSLHDKNKPASPESVEEHTHKGSTVINLLGRVEFGRERDGAESFILKTVNTAVPAAPTTYWCQVIEIPSDIDRYIYKFGPSITESNKNLGLVHHMLVYQCPPSVFSELPVISGMECDEFLVAKVCRGINVLAGWAIGGEDFFYPDDVAYKIAASRPRFGVLEIHYDNPNMRSDLIDSSGVEFTYTRTPSTHLAGVLTVGHHVTPNLLIPPNVENYEIAGFCSSGCTSQFKEINIFAGLLHTHLAGKSLVLRHYRQSEEDENVMEELAPIDQNLNYNVDYQQVNLLPKETKVLPGDSLALHCRYNSTGRSNVTLGGEGTYDEMCLTFLFYYPLQDISLCSSMPKPDLAYSPLRDLANFTELVNILSVAYEVRKVREIYKALENVEWTKDLIEKLKSSTLNSSFFQLCQENFIGFKIAHVPVVDQPRIASHYVPPGKCTSGEEKTASSLSIYFQILVGFVAGIISVSMHYWIV